MLDKIIKMFESNLENRCELASAMLVDYFNTNNFQFLEMVYTVQVITNQVLNIKVNVPTLHTVDELKQFNGNTTTQYFYYFKFNNVEFYCSFIEEVYVDLFTESVRFNTQYKMSNPRRLRYWIPYLERFDNAIKRNVNGRYTLHVKQGSYVDVLGHAQQILDTLYGDIANWGRPTLYTMVDLEIISELAVYFGDSIFDYYFELSGIPQQSGLSAYRVLLNKTYTKEDDISDV